MVVRFSFFSYTFGKTMAGTKFVVQMLLFLMENNLTLYDVPSRRTRLRHFPNYFCIVGYIATSNQYWSELYLFSHCPHLRPQSWFIEFLFQSQSRSRSTLLRQPKNVCGPLINLRSISSYQRTVHTGQVLWKYRFKKISCSKRTDQSLQHVYVYILQDNYQPWKARL